jgi:hypothetical protein
VALRLCEATLPPDNFGGRGGAQVAIASREAPAALLGRPGGGRRESGGHPTRGGRAAAAVPRRGTF